MSRKFLDLSVSLEQGIKSDPDFMLPKINYHHHKETAEEMMSFFPGLKKTDLPGEEGWAMETITVSTHNGTHMDAPYHYHSTMNNGQRAITIDEVPLEWCFSDGVKFDLRSYEDGYVEQGVRVTGTDAWSWDAPFPYTAEKYKQTKDPSIIWEGHRAGMVQGYSHIEKLNNLDQLPNYGFKVSAFPFKIKNGSAGFVRVVAIFE